MTEPATVSGKLLWTPDGSPTELDDYAAFLNATSGVDWAGDYHKLWQWSVDKKEHSGHLCGAGTV